MGELFGVSWGLPVVLVALVGMLVLLLFVRASQHRKKEEARQGGPSKATKTKAAKPRGKAAKAARKQATTPDKAARYAQLRQAAEAAGITSPEDPTFGQPAPAQPAAAPVAQTPAPVQAPAQPLAQAPAQPQPQAQPVPAQAPAAPVVQPQAPVSPVVPAAAPLSAPIPAPHVNSVPIEDVLPGADPLESAVAEILQGWGELTEEDTNRLSVYRPDRVLAIIQNAQLPKDLKGNQDARARLAQLRRWASNLQQTTPLGPTPAPSAQQEYAGITGAQPAMPAAPPMPAQPGPTPPAPGLAAPAQPGPATLGAGAGPAIGGGIGVGAGPLVGGGLSGATGPGIGSGLAPAAPSAPEPSPTTVPDYTPSMGAQAPIQAPTPAQQTPQPPVHAPEYAAQAPGLQQPPSQGIYGAPDSATTAPSQAAVSPQQPPAARDVDNREAEMAEATRSTEAAIAAAAAAFWARPEIGGTAPNAVPGAPAAGAQPPAGDQPMAPKTPPLAPPIPQQAQPVPATPADAGLGAPAYPPLGQDLPTLATPTPDVQPPTVGSPAPQAPPQAFGPSAGYDQFMNDLGNKVTTAEALLALPPAEQPGLLAFLKPSELDKVLKGTADMALKKAVIDTLESVGSPTALDVIHKCLDDPEPQVQSWALAAADRLLGAQ